MAQRSGLPTIRDTAKFLCKFIAGALPVIRRVFPDEEELHLALEVLQAAACALVPLADDALPMGD